MDKKYVIWSDIEHRNEGVIDMLRKAYPSLHYREIADLIFETFGYEIANLYIPIHTDILVITETEFKKEKILTTEIIEDAYLSDCIEVLQYGTWYLDSRGDLRCDTIIRNIKADILYRAFKQPISALRILALQKKIEAGNASRADITKLTRRLGDDIAPLYGWELPRLYRKEIDKP